MAKCDEDVDCSSLECGSDQKFLDGRIKKAHCSYWRSGSCEKAEEFTMNPFNYIRTCKKKEAGI